MMSWRLQRRLCSDCYGGSKLLTVQEIKEQYPDNSADIRKIIPSTFHFPGRGESHRSKRGGVLYLPHDAKMAHEALNEYKKAISTKGNEAENSMNDLIRKRRNRVREFYENSIFMEKAVTAYQLMVRDERRAKMKSRLRALGWSHEAVRRADLRTFEYGDNGCTTMLTDNEWDRIMPSLNQTLNNVTETIHKETIMHRLDSVKKSYGAYLDSVEPLKRASIPYLKDISDEEPFKSLVESTRSDVTEEELEKSLLKALACWRKRTSAHLTSLLPYSFRTRYKARFTKASEGYLGLAVAVFQRERPSSNCGCGSVECSSGQYCRCLVGEGHVPLIGWEHAAVHQCEHRTDDTAEQLVPNRLPQTAISFSEVGSAAAASLVGLVGLDDRKARPSDLDALECAFFCDDCPAVYRDGRWKKQAMTWRSCISHHMATFANTEHATPRWRALTRYEAPKSTSLWKHINGSYMWTCNRCSYSVDSWFLIMAHMEKRNSIISPRMGSDYFVDTWSLASRPPRLPWITLRLTQRPQTPPPVYKCTHCMNNSKRAYSLEEIISHLRSRHKIILPQNPTDCVEK